MELNKEQLEAVLDNRHNLRIIAGAGTGKTRVITQKFIYLCKELSYNPERLLAITFTNKATNEMYERISKEISISKQKSFISTFHAFCLKILRSDIDKLIKLNNRFTVIDQTDKKNIIRQYFKRNNIEYKPSLIKNISLLISYWKINNYINIDYKNYIDNIDDDLYDGNFEIKKAAFKFYQDSLLENNQIDYDDILIYAYNLLLIDSIKNKWQNCFDYIFVDEFQDTDLIQYNILKLIHNNSKIMVVGDPDQNIYSWRGSRIDYILDFDKNFTNVKTIILTKNYRSTPEILNLSNNLISNNKKRYKKNLESTKPNRTLPVIYEIDLFGDEIDNVIKQIKSLKENGEIKSFNEVMILYRNNSFSANLEKQLLKESIPYIIYGGFQFFERREIKRVINLLRILVSQDNFSFSNFMLSLPGIGPVTINKLEKIAKENECSLLEVALRKDLSILIKKLPKEFDSYIKTLKHAMKKVDNFENSVKYLNETLISFNIFKEYTEAFETERIENIQAFCDMLFQFETEHNEFQGTELIYEFLLDLSLFQEKNNYVEKNIQEKSLIMSTIHKAKGLETKAVFIIGVADGILPSNMKKHQEDELEEERRILFVAMTRAKDYLYLSFNKDFSFLINDNFSESIFLEELDTSKYQRIKIPMLTNQISENKQYYNDINVNNLIRHSIFGTGMITEKTEKYLLVNFNGKTKKIYYMSPLWKVIKI